MKKRILSILLMLSMVCLLFAGCGGDKSTSEARQSTDAKTVETQAPAETQAGADLWTLFRLWSTGPICLTATRRSWTIKTR